MPEEMSTSDEQATAGNAPPPALGWREAFWTTPGPRTAGQAMVLWLKGLCMGAADIIPGVSGGTIAFISGIYENFLAAIASVDGQALSRLMRLDVKGVVARVHLRFLVPLLLGIAVAIVSMASLMHRLMDKYPVHTWAVFFGLILASVLVVGREVKQWTVRHALLLVGGVVAAWWITGLIPVQTPESGWFLFLCSVIAICAMVLPGISGSFLLLVLGKYYYVTGQISVMKESAVALVGGGEVNWPALSEALWVVPIFLAGQIVGLITFVRVMKWLLARWHEPTMCVLTGLMIGALRKVWPWNHPVWVQEVMRHGKLKAQVVETTFVLPWNYGNAFIRRVQSMDGGEVQEVVVSGLDPHTVAALALAAGGFVFVLALEWISARLERRELLEDGANANR